MARNVDLTVDVAGLTIRVSELPIASAASANARLISAGPTAFR